MAEPKIEYAAKSAFVEDRSKQAAAMVPAHIRAEMERMNAQPVETRSDEEEVERTPGGLRVLHYRP